MNGWLDRYRALVLLLLVAVIAMGSVAVWLRWDRSQPIEISLPPAAELKGEVCIGGAVASPGYYPLRGRDSIEGLIQAAGGFTATAEPDRLNIYIPEAGEAEQSQKVNINRAEPWLLQALPDIGETLARRIVEYRQRNGPFKSTSDLMKVEGIGKATYEKIKGLITVAD